MTLGLIFFEFHTSLKIQVRTAWQRMHREGIDHQPDPVKPRAFMPHTL